MIRPDMKMFTRSIRLGIDIYRSNAYAYDWYLIKEKKEDGKEKTGQQRGIVWTRDGSKTYYVCPSCRRFNRVVQEGNPLLINGPDLDANLCEVCYGCSVHAWFTLLGWTPRRYRGSIRLHPGKCPECGKPGVDNVYGHDTNFSTGRQSRQDRKTCNGCHLLWRTS
jgi:hypothetical protein